jgi:hypothetical protein
MYVLKKSDKSKSGFSNQCEENILMALVKMIANYDLSANQALGVTEILANDVFGQCWVVPKEKKDENSKPDAKGEKSMPEDTDKFNPYKLPCRKTLDGSVKLYALNAEKEVGKAVLDTDCNVLMSDGTTKAHVGKIMTLPVQSNEKILLLPFHQIANEKQSNLVNLIVYQLQRLETLTGFTKELFWRQIASTMTDLASENHGLAEAVSKQLKLDYVPGQLFCCAHTSLGFAEGNKKDIRDIEQLVGYDKILSNFADSSHRGDQQYCAVWDCKFFFEF